MQKVHYCCCGCSLKGGTLTLIILSLICAILELVNSKSNLPMALFWGLIVTIEIAALYGIFQRLPALIVPHMISQVLMIIALVVSAVLVVVLGTSFAKLVIDQSAHIKNSDDIAKGIGGLTVVVAIVLVLWATLEYYFFVVVYSYYKKAEREN